MFPKDERTPKRWSEECLRLARGIHPDYHRNPHYRGCFIEYVRRAENGLVFSLNFLRETRCGRNTYYFNAAALFSEQATGESLLLPLIIGSRFNPSFTLWRAFEQHVPHSRRLSFWRERFPAGLWSFGEWRSNTLDAVKESMQHVEQHLWPSYSELVSGARERFVKLLAAAAPLLDKSISQNDLPNEILAVRHQFINVGGFAGNCHSNPTKLMV